MTSYYRPLLRSDAHRPANAHVLAGGWTWFDRIEVLSRDQAPRVIAADDLPSDIITRLTAPRVAQATLTWDTPRLMGIINTTPDSFSDGGAFHDAPKAVDQGHALIKEGADILDIGGESTRPGADFVQTEAEINRTAPVIKALRSTSDMPISIDTRKALVGQAALDAGADLVNDVAAFTFDPALGDVTAAAKVPCCLMHAQGNPDTMQTKPHYDNVLFDVYDFLSQRIDAAVAAGIARDQITIDPGIGFGKTLQHNLTLLRGLALFHTLGCPVLLGASRKRFIGTIGGEDDAGARMPGTLAVTLHGIAQGVQLHRVHDIKPIKQALRLDRAITQGWAEHG